MWRKTILFLTAGVCALVLPAPADGKKEEEKQQPLREYVLVTATAVKESEKDVIGSFSLVRRETIAQWKLVNLNEVLDFAGPEFSLAGGSYGQLSSTFIRGASSKHTLFMINNVRLNDPASLSLDVSMISPQVFEQVEVVDGPQSSLYGSEAMGGVVNLVPRQQSGLAASFWGGEAASLSSNIGWGRRLGKSLNVNLGYSFFRTDGTEKNSDFAMHNLYAGADFTHGRMRLKPFVFWARSRTGIPFNMGLPAPERRNRTACLVGGLPLEIRLAERLAGEVTISYSAREYDLEDPQDAWTPWYHTYSRTANIQGRLVWRGLGDASPTIAGAEAGGAWIDEEDTSGKILDGHSFRTHAFWLEQVVNAKGGQAVLSLRGDKFSRFPARISPRLSLSYGATGGEWHAAVYVMANAGFRAPKPAEYASPWGNPDLAPERSLNVEAGVRTAWRGFSLRAGHFITDYRDLIAFDYATYRMQNSEHDRITGWQLQPELALKNVSLFVSFLRLRAVNRDSGERLVRRPDYVLKARLQVEWRKWYAGLFARFVGGRKDFDETSWQVVDADSFGVFSLIAGFRLRPHLNLFVKVQNVLDREYQEIFGYRAPRRMVYAGIDFTL